MADVLPNALLDISHCPVCGDEFNDPRLLSCGHHFCRECLQKIAKASPIGQLSCPTCRHVTEENINGLQQYMVRNFQTSADSFMNLVDQATVSTDKGHVCDYCTSNFATLSCYDCRIVLCSECSRKHSLLENKYGHELLKLSDMQFCKIHSKLFVNWVCSECSIGCCPKCVPDHMEHDLQDMRDKARKARDNLRSYTPSISKCAEDECVMLKLSTAIENLQALRKESISYFAALRKNLQKIEKATNDAEEHFAEEMKAQLKILNLKKWDVCEFIKTKKNLQDYLSELTDKSSDAEMVFIMNHCPKYATNPASLLLEDAEVKIPNIRIWKKNAESLNQVSKSMNLQFVSATMNTAVLQKPFRNMIKTKTLAGIQGSICGLAVNEANGILVIRTDCNIGPIKQYSHEGIYIGCIGNGYDMRVDFDGSVGIAVDGSRSLYVCSRRDGKLVTMDFDGKVVGLIEIKGSQELRGICTLGDTYVCVDKRYRRLRTVNKELRSVEFNFGSSIYLRCPVDITASSMYSLQTSKTISLAVSDLSADIVYGLDMNGDKVAEFGSGKIQLRSPRGLAIDPAERVLVCDRDNDRIVAFGLDGEETILFSSDLLGKKEPRHIAIDSLRRFVYVGYDDGTVFQFKESNL